MNRSFGRYQTRSDIDRVLGPLICNYIPAHQDVEFTGNADDDGLQFWYE